MNTLTPHAFSQARDYIVEHARPLEQHLFAHHFEGAPAAAVLDALAAFQNEDGGFGRALEPDLRAPASSAVATAIALDLLVEVRAPADDARVGRAIAYLLETYDKEAGVWPIVTAAVEEAPHPWWWGYADSARLFDGFLVNPRAAITGHLHHYHTLVPAEFLARLTLAVLDHVATLPDEIGMNDFLCLIDLSGAVHLPPAARAQLHTKLTQALVRSVAHDPAAWDQYNLKPLDVAPSPEAPLAAALPPAELAANLDFVIEQQEPDGSWQPPWSWAEVDAAAWAQAEREWRGHLTLENLKRLRAFGRLETP